MTGRTHLTIAIAVGLAYASTVTTEAKPTLLITLVSLVGGLLPDIDHHRSLISGYVPGSSVVQVGVRHRGFTHSLLFVALLVGVWVLGSQYIPIPYPIAVAGLLGVLSHDLADMVTPAGIQLFYPLRGKWKVAPWFILKPLKWGGLEFLVWCGALAVIVFVFMTRF